MVSEHQEIGVVEKGPLLYAFEVGSDEIVIEGSFFLPEKEFFQLRNLVEGDGPEPLVDNMIGERVEGREQRALTNDLGLICHIIDSE